MTSLNTKSIALRGGVTVVTRAFPTQAFMIDDPVWLRLVELNHVERYG